ncbi:lectin domain protein, partial [Lyngbya aestuarii BL J]
MPCGLSTKVVIILSSKIKKPSGICSQMENRLKEIEEPREAGKHHPVL